MKTHKLSNMQHGWFVGAFTPTVHRTDAVEVAVKEYPAGSHEPAHYHRIATEITVIVSGEARMAGASFGRGDIVVMAPNDITDFTALTDVTTVVVKIPGALDDKYPAP